MINEEIKQALLNGAYGITRNGFKCKYIGTNILQRYVFAFFNDKGEILHVIDMLGKFNRFKHDEEGEFDVVGLWEDKPEPFNLDKALKGEPVMTREGNKAYIKYCLPEEYKNGFPLGGYIINSKASINHYSWSLTGKAVEIKCNHPQDIIGMWKDEPVSNTVTLPLPCPLKEPQDKMWIVTYGGAELSLLDKTISAELFDKRIFFGSKEDAQAWFDAMRDNRR
ncbi:hypothetical protein Q7469_11510 [Glaesserella parasuis]|uniref:hypothetical protein n=1 Tax=Glaesserella parasuis TaxID=738 RepID=UPI002436E9B7|nr:hypothetical protein [Glaesserella parasuis]MDG6346173.1 hypothetical protein [Glaesserella parasuis]MDO9914337.1 hypothetical protein [Glaesserella parasuis]MDP0350770.1 hypothetical protein [Glaesserella parasuis]